MNFYDLPAKDRETMEAWIDEYAPGDVEVVYKRSASMDTIFTPWATAKNDHLYPLLNNQFILKKEIEMFKSTADLEEDMIDMLAEEEVKTFINNFLAKTNDFYYNIDTRCYLIHLFKPENLVENTMKTVWQSFCFELPNEERPIIVNRDMKLMKIIGKLCSAFNIDGFEEFRQKHSQVLNQKKIKGTLCLSIHPMDFMTMSDNENGWQSCMNWREPGDYRQGTVEMMNSPNVLVAYIESNSVNLEFSHYKNNDRPPYVWNSKKWRQLFYVDDNLIVGVKAYPYQADELTLAVRKWIMELGTENMGWEYETIDYDFTGERLILDDQDQKNIEFNTGLMYSDFGCLPDNKRHQMRLTRKGLKTILDSTSYIDMEYSGLSECMWCGETCRTYEDGGWIDSNMCVCYNCGSVYRCSCCGERIYNQNEVFYIYDDIYCECCYDEYACEDSITGDIWHRDDIKTIYVSPYVSGYKETDREYSITVGWDSYINWNDYLVNGKDSIHTFHVHTPWRDKTLYYINWPDIKPEAWPKLFEIQYDGFYFKRFVTNENGEISNSNKSPYEDLTF